MRLASLKWVVVLVAAVPLSAGADIGPAIGFGSGAPGRDPVVTPPQVTNVADARNVEMQQALNRFGFGAGVPDGVVGQETQAAIDGFQAFLHDPMTGRLTRFEYDFLIGAYRRALAAGPRAGRRLANGLMGPRAFLLRQRDMMSGGPMTAPSAGGAVAPAALTAGPVAGAARAAGGWNA